MKNFYLIGHIICQPGAGTTLFARMLAMRLHLPIYCIGEFRAKFPATVIGETDACGFERNYSLLYRSFD